LLRVPIFSPKHLYMTGFLNSQKDYLTYLFYLVFFSLLPAWVTFFILVLTGHWEKMNLIWDGGSLFVYSAALLGTVIYDLRAYTKKTASLIGFIYALSILLLIFSAIGFSISILAGILSSLTPPLPAIAVQVSSIFLITSILVAYYANYHMTQAPDPEKRSHRKVKEIMSKLP
jgi:hypothetical protein